MVLLVVFLSTCLNHSFIDPLPHLPHICPANHLDKKYIFIAVLERVMQQTGLDGFATKNDFDFYVRVTAVMFMHCGVGSLFIRVCSCLGIW